MGTDSADRLFHLIAAVRKRQVICQIQSSTRNAQQQEPLRRTTVPTPNRFYKTIDIQRAALEGVVHGNVLHDRHAGISKVNDQIRMHMLDCDLIHTHSTIPTVSTQQGQTVVSPRIYRFTSESTRFYSITKGKGEGLESRMSRIRRRTASNRETEEPPCSLRGMETVYLLRLLSLDHSSNSSSIICVFFRLIRYAHVGRMEQTIVTVSL